MVVDLGKSDVHFKIQKLQEALDELKKEVGFDEGTHSENLDEGGSHIGDGLGGGVSRSDGLGKVEEDELGEEINLSESSEEDELGHFDTHRI